MSSEENDAMGLIHKMIRQAQEKDEEEDRAFTKDISGISTEKIIKPNLELGKVSKALVGYHSFTLLDGLFINEEGKNLAGIPIESNAIITGLPNSGKSLILEQIALANAHYGVKVAYVLSEEVFRTDGQRYDLENRLRHKAGIMNLDWNKIHENLFVVDAVTDAEYRDWTNFVSVYRKLVEQEGIKLLLVDSMTLLETQRMALKHRVMELNRYNQRHKVSSILVNQRAVEESDSMAMAGGIALSHIVDIVIAMDYKKASSWDKALKQDTGCGQGETVNFIRVLKCRLSRFDAHYIAYQIDDNGIVKPK